MISPTTLAAAQREPPQDGRPRLAFVDGLRAVAVLTVVLSHAAKYTMDFHDGVSYHVLYEGAHGVDLFFVISGLCLAYPTLAKWRASTKPTFDVVEFFNRRIVRIMPPYWTAFAVILIAAGLALRFGPGLPWPTIKIPTLAMGLRQLFFVDDGSSLVCGSFWTLALEFRWYILFPLVLWLYTRSPVVLAVVCAAGVAIYNFTPIRPWDLATLPAFVLGVVAADWIIRGLPICRFALPLCLGALVLSAILEPKGHLDYALQNQLWWQATAFFLVLAGATNRFLRAVLEHRAAVFIGAASYSIYLLHDPGMAWYGYTGGTNVLAAIAIGVLSGVAFWYCCERYVVSGDGKRRLLDVVGGTLRALPGSRALKLPVGQP